MLILTGWGCHSDDSKDIYRAVASVHFDTKGPLRKLNIGQKRKADVGRQDFERFRATS